jgi:hypothetical protein
MLQRTPMDDDFFAQEEIDLCWRAINNDITKA